MGWFGFGIVVKIATLSVPIALKSKAIGGLKCKKDQQRVCHRAGVVANRSTAENCSFNASLVGARRV